MAKKPVKPAPLKAPYASARIGNYRAPVDTTGMDEDMKETMGIKRAAPKRKGAK